MVTGEMEKSLREEIDGYLKSRMNELQEEIERLHGQVNEAFTRLSERSAGDTQDTSPVAVSIAEHLRAAHERGVEQAAAESTRARASSEMAILKSAIEDIDDQRSQTGILERLVNSASSFAPRVAFFVIKNEQAIGWRARGLEGTVGDDSIREISLPLSADTLLGDVVASRAVWSGQPGSKADEHLLLGRLGAEPPQRMAAVPLIARGKTVAVLYADSAALDADAIKLEAIETLVRVASMAVELLAVSRIAPVAREAQNAATQVPTSNDDSAVQPVHPSEPANDEVTQERDAQTSNANSFNDATTAVPQMHEEASYEAPSSYASQQDDNADAGTQYSGGQAEQGYTDEQSHHPEYAAVSEQNYQPEQSHQAEQFQQPEQSYQHEQSYQSEQSGAFDPDYTSEQTLISHPVIAPDQYQAQQTGPLNVEAFAPQQQPAPDASSSGNSPSPAATGNYGNADSNPPLDMSEDEQRLHNDARRFARLLVSEIKLYNEQKVRDGRAQGNLYERLHEDIDRSRQMYDKRVSAPVASRFDYFHQELVNTLAEGDSSKLGAGYPGASA